MVDVAGRWHLLKRRNRDFKLAFCLTDQQLFLDVACRIGILECRQHPGISHQVIVYVLLQANAIQGLEQALQFPDHGAASVCRACLIQRINPGFAQHAGGALATGA